MFNKFAASERITCISRKLQIKCRQFVRDDSDEGFGVFKFYSFVGWKVFLNLVYLTGFSETVHEKHSKLQ